MRLTPGCAARADGEWDLAHADRLAELLEEHQKAGRRAVHLDVSGVTFLDYTCLGVLVAAHQRQLADGGTLLLTGTTPRIMRLLSLTRLEGVLLTTTGSDRNVVHVPSTVPTRRRSAEKPITRPAETANGTGTTRV